MKNLMKSSLYLLSFTFLLASCGGESSTKGNWTSSDMDRCTSDIISEMKADPEAKEMMDLAGTTIEEFSTCACEKIEGLYESESKASVALDGMSDDEAGLMILSCFGDLEEMMKLAMEMEDESVSSRNLTYTCPLCDGVTEFSCPDCSSDLIWCELDGDVTSYHCPSCEFYDLIWETCAHCDKDLRSSTKFWTNKSGQNHDDCDW